MHDIGLYVHIPFCRHKCNYCSFASYQSRETDIAVYLCALKAELAQRAGGRPIRSIYFGGGTPSLLSPEQIGGILATIDSLSAVNEAAEITIEANPGTLDTAYLAAVRGLGVNRLSLGAQSMNNRELDLLGRIHKAAEVQEAVHCARSAGFENLNLDLIYGLPGQGLSGWQRTLDEAIAMKPEHLSLYALTLDAETPMWRAIKEMSLPDIDPDLSADQYEMAEDLLAAHGYRHYEISNWAKEGRECRHNMVYWQNRPYLGVGVAAHSWLDGHRMANIGNLDEYLAAFAGKRPLLPDMDEVIGLDLELAETVILGLRLEAGVDINSLKNRFGIDVLSYYSQPIREMVDSGLMKHAGEYIRLTRRGRLLSNEVFWRILPGN